MKPANGEAERAILHVDMDAFYASVEALENPALRNKPLIVGGDGERGVVASCSYEARFYGVRSAMPSVRARRLCPQAIFVAGHYGLYEQYSARMHKIFQYYTPEIEGISLDEAFLDVTGAQKLFGEPRHIAHLVRGRIYDELGLHASVGVATTKHVAKLASEAAKPKAAKHGPIPGKGVVVVTADAAVEFLHPLPVRALWGVGPATEDRLSGIGVHTVGQLARLPIAVVASAVGAAHAQHLHDLAWNRDERMVISERVAKSIGHEQTYPRDLRDRESVHAQLVRLTDAVTKRLRREQLAARTFTVKVRFKTFRTITRSRTVPKATATAGIVLKLTDELVSAIPIDDIEEGVRLLGISASNLEEQLPAEQLSLSDTSTEVESPDRPLDDAIDRIRERFGDGSLVPAPLIAPGSYGVFHQGERQWGPNAEE